ncbi:Peroxyureidoacrylate_ureidoacrylate amidohydrolase RutB (plasmid) [Actinosynnema sp. ALI-1.44]
MDLTNTVLLVVDMQNGFVNDGSRHVVPVITDLVHRWQGLGGDVLFTRFLNAKGSNYERLIGWTAMRGDGSPADIDLVDDLKPFAARAFVLDKPIYSVFTEEGTRLFAEQGWTNLVICGIATESCVLTTAVSAFEKGLVPYVVADACASHARRSSEAHAAGLVCIGRNVGRKQLITSADVTQVCLAATA